MLELILDNTKCAKIEGLDCFENLETLSLNGCGLVNLDGFPSLEKLSKVRAGSVAVAWVALRRGLTRRAFFVRRRSN